MSTAPDLSPAEAARVAAFDAAQVPPECDPERVETVARALWNALPATQCGWDGAPEEDRAVWRRLAAAAIAALPPSPAELAVQRVEALADEWAQSPYSVTAAYALRAALASPAPAPQGEACPRRQTCPQPGWCTDCPRFDPSGCADGGW